MIKALALTAAVMLAASCTPAPAAEHGHGVSDAGTDRHEGVGGHRAPVWVPGEPRLRNDHPRYHRGFHGPPVLGDPCWLLTPVGFVYTCE